jgi:hypothetical protein
VPVSYAKQQPSSIAMLSSNARNRLKMLFFMVVLLVWNRIEPPAVRKESAAAETSGVF